MKLKPIICIKIALAVTLVPLAAAGLPMEGPPARAIVQPDEAKITGPVAKVYADPGNGIRLILFKFRGFRLISGGEEASGTWTVDPATGKLILKRFDSGEALQFTVFALEGEEGYLLGYRHKSPENGRTWGFLQELPGGPAEKYAGTPLEASAR